jgi:hypothetical protein
MRRTNIVILALTLATAAAGFAAAQTTHPLSKAGQGDWALYSVTVENSTTPLLSVKDKQRWRAVTMVQETGVRVDSFTLMGGRKAGLGPSMIDFNKPFEPVFEISLGAKIEVLSSVPENLTVKGKTYACTKIVRKVSRPLSPDAMLTGWNGTSTVWTCLDVPLGGIVKIENQYEYQDAADSKPDKIKETWTLADFGLKNWEE